MWETSITAGQVFIYSKTCLRELRDGFSSSWNKKMEIVTFCFYIFWFLLQCMLVSIECLRCWQSCIPKIINHTGHLIHSVAWNGFLCCNALGSTRLLFKPFEAPEMVGRECVYSTSVCPNTTSDQSTKHFNSSFLIVIHWFSWDSLWRLGIWPSIFISVSQ